MLLLLDLDSNENSDVTFLYCTKMQSKEQMNPRHTAYISFIILTILCEAFFLHTCGRC